MINKHDEETGMRDYDDLLRALKTTIKLNPTYEPDDVRNTLQGISNIRDLRIREDDNSVDFTYGMVELNIFKGKDNNWYLNANATIVDRDGAEKDVTFNRDTQLTEGGIIVWTVDAYSSDLTYNGEDSITHRIYNNEEAAQQRCDAMNKAFGYGCDENNAPTEMDYLYYEVGNMSIEAFCDNSDIPKENEDEE